MDFYAHSAEGRSKKDWQPLSAHLSAVAEAAATRGCKFDARDLAYVAGLLHDLGKYTAPFQARLEGGEPVDHSTAGAQEVSKLFEREKHAAQLIAYAIAGHHAGLPDYHGDGESDLQARLKKAINAPDDIWRGEVGPLPDRITPFGLKPHPDPANHPLGLQLAMLGRFVFSCLVDADFRDTEDYYIGLEERTVDRSIDASLEDLKAKLDAHLETMRKTDTDVNRLRGDVLTHVRAKADLSPGLFSLTVPTGGGKTLTSLAFALDHAVKNGLDRVIYAIPFTSVIDQTVAVFRSILGEEAIVEHHSAIDQERLSALEGADKLRLAMEDWAAPIIVTTNVQLFESLYANRPSRCRKLHNLARSVIVLDEAQTIPRSVLRPCVAAIDELARNYRTTVVLCTATQPALKGPDFRGGLQDVRELAPDPDGLQARLKRVTFRRAGEMTDGDLVAALRGASQALVIVNSRTHALKLYRLAREAELDGVQHLTTRMVAVHRRALLSKIREDLASGRPCRVVATSLVEAGVDLDFPAVWRAEAGLDQIMQAAGRCNREGRKPPEASIVTVFRPAEERDRGPRDVRGLASAMEHVWTDGRDPSSLTSLEEFFREVYWRAGDQALDANGVMAAFPSDRSGTAFSYRTVAENFHLIEEGMAPVIVVRDETSRAAVAALPFAERTGGLARTLQPYTVQVPPKDRQALIAAGQVAYRDKAQQFAVLEDRSLYREDEGLVLEEAGFADPVRLIL